jgi:hypothetical protein
MSGKIRRVELRDVEVANAQGGSSAEHAYSEDDFPG